MKDSSIKATNEKVVIVALEYYKQMNGGNSK